MSNKQAWRANTKQWKRAAMYVRCRFYICLRFFYLIFELFRQCGTFLFSLLLLLYTVWTHIHLFIIIFKTRCYNKQCCYTLNVKATLTCQTPSRYLGYILACFFPKSITSISDTNDNKIVYILHQDKIKFDRLIKGKIDRNMTSVIMYQPLRDEWCSEHIFK